MTNDWHRTKEVELTSGRKLLVRSVPPFLSLRAMAELPLPEPPVREIKSQIPGGGTEYFEDKNDPTYKKAYQDVVTKRMELVNEIQWLYSLPDVAIPEDDDWKKPIDEVYEKFSWRPGARGRKLDYIEYVILSNSEDLRRIRAVLSELNQAVNTEVLAKVAEESFRGNPGGDALKETSIG